MKQRINAFAKGPKAGAALGALGTYMKNVSVNQELLELLYYRVSQINGCAFCLDMPTSYFVNRTASIKFHLYEGVCVIVSQTQRRPGYTNPIQPGGSGQKWQTWVEGIAQQGQLHHPGMRLGDEGKVLRGSGVVTDGPFVEIKEQLGGFLVVRANHLDEAITLAHG